MNNSNNSSSNNDDVHRFKIVILGDTGVGKTSLIVRFVRDAFRKFEATTGGTFYTKKLELDNNTIVKLNIWDTSGQERFRSVAPLYYKGAAACIVVYDVTNYLSFVSAKSWIDELLSTTTTTTTTLRSNDGGGGGAMKITLVGNKIDLLSEQPSCSVTFREAQSYVQEQQQGMLLHFETSAKTAKNVRAVFCEIAKELLPQPELLPHDDGEEEEEESTTTTTSLTNSNTITEPLVPQRERKKQAQRFVSCLLNCFKRKMQRN